MPRLIPAPASLERRNQGVASRNGKNCGVPNQITSPEPPRILDETEQPFEARATHDAWCPPFRTAEKAERAAHAKAKPLGLAAVPQAIGHNLLLRRADR